jgi:hypothetical protein
MNIIKKNTKAFFLLAFILLTSFLMYYHDLWRDEWLAINLATETKSIYDLLIRLQFEGHPPLWYLIVKAGWSIFPSEIFIKIIHLFISWFIGYIILFRISLRLNYKLLILFSYFIFFEYTIPVRNYNLVILFGFFLVNELQKEKINIIKCLVFLVGMSASHAYGVMLSLSFSLYIFLQYRFVLRNFLFKKKAIFIIAPILLLCITGLIQLMPPGDHVSIDNSKWTLASFIKFAPKSLSAFWNSFIPIPILKVSFWNTNFIDPVATFIYKNLDTLGFINSLKGDEEKKRKIISYFLKAPLGVGIIFFAVRRFFKEKYILFSLIFGWLLIYAFQLYVYYGFLRHAGFYFILFLFFIIISKKEPGKFAIIILYIHLATSFIAFYYEARYSFSSAKAASEYIFKEGGTKADAIISMDNYNYVPSIAGYLNKGVYLYGQKDPQRYVLWESVILNIPLDSTILQFKNKISGKGYKKGFLVFTDPLEIENVRKYFKEGYLLDYSSFTGSISGENFYVVMLRKEE